MRRIEGLQRAGSRVAAATQAKADILVKDATQEKDGKFRKTYDSRV